MIARLIERALQQRWLVLIFVALIASAGVYAFTQQPVDAYPDISGQMVQIITVFPGRAPEEVERQVTVPVEIAMRNVPHVGVVRSRTIFGLSVVQMNFDEGTEMYWARQRVQEKLAGITLPDGASPDLGPLATAYGEIFRYELVMDGVPDLMELRTLNDWVVVPRLLRVPGVADVSNFGGLAKQFTVLVRPIQLQRYGLSLDDVVQAVKTNNTVAGGSFVSRGSMAFVVRGGGALGTLADVQKVFVKSIGGMPITLKDIAQVELGAPVPSGIFGKDHNPDSVEGICLMRRGENPSRVLDEMAVAVEELNTARLPAGVKVKSFYDRQHLVDSTLHTVGHSVGIGIGLVVLVLLLFLGRPTMAFLVALTIPFSLLVALVLMWATGIPIGLLSIGAIDFGIIVDGAVIMAENIARRLGEVTRHTGHMHVNKAILDAAQEVEHPVFVSVMMIMVAYLPLLSLTSIEGLLFRPMALTMIYALIGSLVFALFVVPVLATFAFRQGYTEWENPLLAVLRPLYSWVLRLLLRLRWLVLGLVVCGVAAVLVRVVPALGIEFLPYMDEGVVWVRANFPEGTKLEETAKYGSRLREIALEFDDVQFVTTQTGRNDSGTDPFPPSRIEMMIGPRPQHQWTRFKLKHDLVAAIGARFRTEFASTRFNFTQPIIDSVTEDTNGTSANLAVEFSGPDPDELLELGRQTVDLLSSVPGARDVNIEQEGPQPQLVIRPDRKRCARLGVRIDDLAQTINVGLGGQPVSTIFEGERRFDLVVKLDRETLSSPSAIARTPVFTNDGRPIPLGSVADIEVVDGQTIIARENGRRRITVRCDIEGRDQGSFVRDAQTAFDRKLRGSVPAGYTVSWLGMFENLERAKRHFMLLIPLTAALLFALLVLTFQSVSTALVILMGIPFACMGGLLALHARGMHVNVSTGVGFAALFGIAIMDGVLIVKGITALRLRGLALDQAIVIGGAQRLRPILMTAIVAIFGLLPASLATGLGSDVQRPLATVIVWGLLSSTILTLFVVPVLYRILVRGAVRSDTEMVVRPDRAIEPIPDVPVPAVLSLLEYLAARDSAVDLFRIPHDVSLPLDRVVTLVKAGEMLEFVETPGHDVVLTAAGRKMAQFDDLQRRRLWGEHLYHLRLFKELRTAIQSSPDHTLDHSTLLQLIMAWMPFEDYERVLHTLIAWAHFGGTFEYDEAARRLSQPPEQSV